MAFKKTPEKIKPNQKREEIEKISPTREKEPATEISPEKTAEQPEKQAESKEGGAGIEKFGESAAGLATKRSIQDRKDQRQKKIEEVLEEDLEDIYSQMSPDKQKEFKEKGEETVEKINNLLKKTRVNIRKIAGLIKKWLSIIPGINKFFLEQEAKIKTDKIIKIKEDKYYE